MPGFRCDFLTARGGYVCNTRQSRRESKKGASVRVELSLSRSIGGPSEPCRDVAGATRRRAAPCARYRRASKSRRLLRSRRNWTRSPISSSCVRTVGTFRSCFCHKLQRLRCIAAEHPVESSTRRATQARLALPSALQRDRMSGRRGATGRVLLSSKRAYL
jgi:hypothetical protein